MKIWIGYRLGTGNAINDHDRFVQLVDGPGAHEHDRDIDPGHYGALIPTGAGVHLSPRPRVEPDDCDEELINVASLIKPLED